MRQAVFGLMTRLDLNLAFLNLRYAGAIIVFRAIRSRAMLTGAVMSVILFQLDLAKKIVRFSRAAVVHRILLPVMPLLVASGVLSLIPAMWQPSLSANIIQRVKSSKLNVQMLTVFGRGEVLVEPLKDLRDRIALVLALIVLSHFKLHALLLNAQHFTTGHVSGTLDGVNLSSSLASVLNLMAIFQNVQQTLHANGLKLNMGERYAIRTAQ